jgi:hypothetical protein
MRVMNRLMCLLVTPLLLGGGVVSAQPVWDDGESFDDFREEWNGWVESLNDDERAAEGLAEVLERFNDERKQELDPQRGIWTLDVLLAGRPWNEYWVFREEGLRVYQDELNMLDHLAGCAHLGAPISTIVDDPELDQDAEYLPSYWVQEYQLVSVSPIRTAIQYLVSDAVCHAFEGRQEVSVQRFEAASRLCAFFLELPTDLGLLSELACRRVVREAIIESIEYDPDIFHDAQLARLQALLISDLATEYTDVWRFESRVAHADWGASFGDEDPYQLDLLAAMYHDHASIYIGGDFSSFFSLVIEPDLDPRVRLAPVNKQVAIHTQILGGMLEDLRASPVALTRLSSSTQMRAHLSGDNASRFVPVFVDTALWRTQLGSIHRNNYETANQIAVISIYRHRARHGAWPTALDEIDPQVLPIPAIDYYSGEPLRYTLIHGEPRLWALGADRDDDGGRIRKHETSTMNPAYTWYALDEWDALSEAQRADLDGDLRILN